MVSSNCYVWADGVALASSPIGSNITVWSTPSQVKLKQGLGWNGSSTYVWADGVALASSLIGSSINAWQYHLEPCLRKAHDDMFEYHRLRRCDCSREQLHRLKRWCLRHHTKPCASKAWNGVSNTIVWDNVTDCKRSCIDSKNRVWGTIPSLDCARIRMMSQMPLFETMQLLARAVALSQTMVFEHTILSLAKARLKMVL